MSGSSPGSWAVYFRQLSVMWSRALRWYTRRAAAFRTDWSWLTGKLAGRPAGYFHSSVGSEPKRPPSGVWLSGPSGGFDAADATRRNIAIQYFWRASASTGHCQYRYLDCEQTLSDWRSSRQSAVGKLVVDVPRNWNIYLV